MKLTKITIESAAAICNAFAVATRTTQTETTNYVLLPIAGYETFLLRAADEAVRDGVIFA